MNDDKALLEAAAKVAGIEYDPAASKPHPKSGAWWGLWLVYRDEPSEYDRRYWNPLTDDGDALRLAVKLRLHINIEPYGASARQQGKDWNGCESHLHGGLEAATRRAIVRAAAALAARVAPPPSKENP